MHDPMKPIDMPSVGSCPPGQIRYYGCCLCQRNHFEGTPLFKEHLWHQSKHSIQTMSREAYFRLVSESN